MLRALVVAVALALAAAPATAQFIDTSNATVKVGKYRVDSDGSSAATFTLTNLSTQKLSFVPVECTALGSDDEPLETNAHVMNNVAPGEKAYGEVYFLQLHGRTDVSVTCRVSYIRID